MIRNHSEEKDVQEAMILPKKSTERRNAWQKIIRQGDFNANIEMMKWYRHRNCLSEEVAVMELTESLVVCARVFLKTFCCISM